MTTTEPALLMTMSDIASLARVQRPVVSMWRSRSAHSDSPFPSPITQQRGQELFDAQQVGTWLTETKRGNNPDASADAAAHASLERAAHAEGATFYPVSALLTLRSAIGAPLGALTREALSRGALSRDDLLDAADEHDPDDDSFYREIEAISPDTLPSLARYVDTLVEAAYNEPAAFEKLMADRFKLAQRDLADTALTGPALQLMADAANALAATQSHGGPVFVDATGSAGDVLLAIARTESDAHDLSVITADDDSDAARLLRRRLLVHRITRESLAIQNDGSFSVSGNLVHIAHFPPAHRAEMTAVEMLTAIDHTVLQMDDRQLAVMLAPAAVFADAGVPREVDELRSAILRSGRVRAIVRLPHGLLIHKPQQALALWVLGAAHAQIELADRWTLVADLTAVDIEPAAIDDLVSDLVASLGDQATVRAHSFRFARLVLTRAVLASRDSLVAGARGATPMTYSLRVNRSTPPAARGAALAVRGEQLLAELNAPGPANGAAATDAHGLLATDAASLGLQIAIEPLASTEISAHTTPATVEQLIAAGHLRYVAGNRLDPADVLEGLAEASSIRVIGPDEVVGVTSLGQRRIDRLRFAAGYPAGRVTEPGDVIFCTAPRPRAFVDAEGTSVVEFPARILRINSRDPIGLLSEVVAADIDVLPAAHRAWRRWSLRQVSALQQGALPSALDALRTERERVCARLARLDELTSLLIDGAAAGEITVTTDTPL